MSNYLMSNLKIGYLLEIRNYNLDIFVYSPILN